MDENSGLSPQFNLGEVIRDFAPSEHDQIPAVLAANAIKRSLDEDPKTGLATEKAWVSSLAHTIETLSDEDNLIIWVADVNGFKRVNDALGHSAGDELLGVIGGVFGTVFSRTSDVIGHGSRENQDGLSAIARLGGDEFAVFSVNKEGDRRGNPADEEARIQSNRVRELLLDSIAGTKFDGLGVGLSIGAAIMKSDEDAKTAFARADINMYEDKASGQAEHWEKQPRRKRISKRLASIFLKYSGVSLDRRVH